MGLELWYLRKESGQFMETSFSAFRVHLSYLTYTRSPGGIFLHTSYHSYETKWMGIDLPSTEQSRWTTLTSCPLTASQAAWEAKQWPLIRGRKPTEHSTNIVTQSPQFRTCVFDGKHQSQCFCLFKTLCLYPSTSEGASHTHPSTWSNTVGPSLGTSAVSPGDKGRKDDTINPINQQRW